MTLLEATRDMHHACEAHPIGQRMSRGDLTPREWADWLDAFRVLHSVVDLQLPGHMARDALLAADLALLPAARKSAAALTFAGRLAQAEDVTGAAYVLHGAHRSGGRMMAPILAAQGLPCAHIAYADQAAVQAWVAAARSRGEMAGQARMTFDCLMGVMDEIACRMQATRVRASYDADA
jgi:heme oxygenase